MNDPRARFDAAIAAGSESRDRVQRSRTWLGLGVSFAILVIWAIYVTAASHWGRVGDHWASGLTMVFGSFVAGSTPQGGGAVAFPVFTKVLDVDAELARTFSLCIQSIGMGAASAAIILNRRLIVWRAVAIALPAASVAFLFGLFVLGRPDDPFWPSHLPGPYVKVTFTLIVAAMAVVVYVGYRVHLLERLVVLPVTGPRVIACLVVGGLLGGLASSLVGSGADVFVYLAVVVLIGISPRVGVPTSVIVMTGVSILGMIVLGIIDSQLSIELNAAGQVTGLGGEAIGAGADGVVEFGATEPLEASRYDLFGLWLAAVPVVGFGAPLGSWASSRVTDRQLVRFVVALAVAETVTTIIFLDGLLQNPDGALIAYAIIGAVVVIGGLWLLERYRRPLLGLPPVDLDRSFTRVRLDTGPQFREQLAATDEDDANDDEDEEDADDDKAASVRRDEQ